MRSRNYRSVRFSSSDRGYRLFSGYEWVGWRNDTFGMAGKPVEMIFEFDTVRNFTSIVLHTNNMFTKDVAVSGPTSLNAFCVCRTRRAVETGRGETRRGGARRRAADAKSKLKNVK